VATPLAEVPLKDLSLLHPQVRERHQLAALYFRILTGATIDARNRLSGGSEPVVTSTGRTWEEQEKLYAAKDSNPYPVNRPGDSAHNVVPSLAVDSDVPDHLHPLWKAVREYVGFRVPANDAVHGEVPNWRQIVGLRGS